MARLRKEKNREWSSTKKLEIVNKVLLEHQSYPDVAKEYDLSTGQIANWVKKYRDLGETGLENKRKPGNPLAKYQSSKNLSELEKLEYEVMKLRIENERLKKGYQVEGSGQNKVFNTISKKNSK